MCSRSSQSLGYVLYLQVIATVRSRAKFPKELEELGATPVLVDFRAPDAEIRRAADEALQVYGRVDVLVNNAGTVNGGTQPVEEMRCVRCSTRSLLCVNRVVATV